MSALKFSTCTTPIALRHLFLVSINWMDECINYARATRYGKNRTAACVGGRQTTLLCFGINGVGHLFRLQCDGLIALGFDIESGRG